MLKYSEQWDMSSVPWAVLAHETAVRNAGKRAVLRPCMGCGKTLNTRQRRKPCPGCGYKHTQQISLRA